MLTPQKLQVLTSMQLSEKWATPLNQAMDEFAINVTQSEIDLNAREVV